VDQQPENQPNNPIPTNNVQPPVVEQPPAGQPAPAPVVPMPGPVAPQPPNPQVSPVVPAPTGNKKTLLIIGAIVAAVVVIIVVALVIWLTVFRVSKADYQKAGTAFNDMHKTYDTLSDDLTSFVNDDSSTSSSDVATQTATLKKDLATYSQQFDDLGKMRAMHDKDVKQKYDAAADQNKKFVQYLQSFAATMPAFGSAADDCSASKADGISSATPSTVLNAYDSALQPCMNDLNTISKSANASLAAYGSQTLSIYKDQRSALSQMVDAYNAQDQTAYDTAQTNFENVTEEFYNVTTGKITDGFKAVQVADQMTALGSVLSSKS
jgi:hypothetical protein